MDAEESVAKFVREHAIDASRLLEPERDAIAHVVACRHAIQTGYVDLPGAVLESEKTIGFCLNVFERCAERVDGALVSMIARCPAASEVLARSVIEACASLRYILLRRNENLGAFFSNHIVESERQQDRWRRAIQELHVDAQAIHLKALDYRGRATAAMREMVTELNEYLVEEGHVGVWPNIAERFGAIGDAVAYRTVYARLCAEPHLDAEETLRFYVGKTTNYATQDKLAVETLAFSRFMLCEAVSCFARAGKVFAETFGMEAAREVCIRADTRMIEHALALSGAMGALPEAG